MPISISRLFMVSESPISRASYRQFKKSSNIDWYCMKVWHVAFWIPQNPKSATYIDFRWYLKLGLTCIWMSLHMPTISRLVFFPFFLFFFWGSKKSHSEFYQTSHISVLPSQPYLHSHLGYTFSGYHAS